MTTVINSDFELQYRPARIVKGKEIYIIYYAWHPVELRLKCKKMRFNHMVGKVSKAEIDKHIRKVANDININLAAGKNPFISADVANGYETLTKAIDNFLIVKEKEMRKDGFKSYRSYCKKLNAYLTDKKLTDIFAVNFSEDLAIDFMNLVELDPNVGSRSWNNHFVFFRSLWYWLIEKRYCKNNIFVGFKKKRENEKIRQVISKAEHLKIMDWCKENNPRFEIILDLVRCSFLRPAEICRVKISDIDLFNQVIHVSAEKAKTHNFRFAYLPEWLCVKFANLYNLERYLGTDYLVSTRLDPGTQPWDTRKLDKIWEKMRNDLNFGKEMQLYSYRDTGITALENDGVPESAIRKLTDHKSDRMLRNYVRNPSKELIDSVVSRIKE